MSFTASHYMGDDGVPGGGTFEAMGVSIDWAEAKMSEVAIALIGRLELFSHSDYSDLSSHDAAHAANAIIQVLPMLRPLDAY